MIARGTDAEWLLLLMLILTMSLNHPCRCTRTSKERVYLTRRRMQAGKIGAWDLSAFTPDIAIELAYKP